MLQYQKQNANQQWLKGTMATGGQKEYQKIEKIGRGQEGDIYLGEVKGTLEKIAIKEYKSEMQIREKDFLEILLINQEKFNHLIKIKDLIKRNDGTVSAVVMELANGNLFEYMKNVDYKKTSDKEKSLLFLQIIKGIEQVHSLEYFHRDLKSSNIVYFEYQEGMRKEVKLKICDFGIAKPSEKFQTLNHNTGTKCYRPKEQNTGYYQDSVDIWALGVIWFEMFCIIIYLIRI